MAAVASYELATNDSVNSLMLEEGSVSSAPETSSRMPSRRETEQILDYYQSEDAGRASIDPKSAYSQDGHATQSEQDYLTKGTRPTLRPRNEGRDANAGAGRTSIDSVASSASGGVQRRTSQRSARGGDRRRMAIVETDSSYESQGSSLRAQRSYTSESSYQLLSESGLLAKRGMDGSRLEGLALMAPADVHLSSFTDLSQAPSYAPATGGLPTGISPKAGAPSSSHQRSISDLQSRKKTSPRDVGIVGTLGTISPPLAPPTETSPSETSDRGRPATANYDQGDTMDCSLTAPVFQTPKSRSPSPLPPTSEPSPLEAPTGERSQFVKDGLQPSQSIGQEKEVGHPNARPVFVDLTSSVPVFRHSPKVIPSGLPVIEPPTNEPHTYGEHPQRNAGRLPFKPNQAGPTYLHYQPGIHATAGPLPSPPRHILTQISNSPPPRPPRLLTPVSSARRNESDQPQKSNKTPHSDGSNTIISQQAAVPITREGSDFSIAAVSVSSSESEDKSREENLPAISPTEPEDVEETPLALSFRKGSHVREGAFPASSVYLSRPSKSPPRNQSHSPDKVEATDKEEPPRLNEVPPSAVAELSRVLKRSRSRSNLRREEGWASESVESAGDGLDETSPPSSYPPSREGSMHVNLTSDDGHVRVDRRRTSLPTPSEPQKLFHSLPRTPSLLFTRNNSSPSPQPAVSRRAPSAWPEAMNFHEVLTRKTAAERALGYAAKMSSLAREETGLRDWLLLGSRKERRVTPASHPLAATPLPPGSIKHLRRVSRTSMASEITFPIRTDSYAAIDLSLRPKTEISSPISPPPSLPYPSLAHGVGIRNHITHRSTHSDSSSWGATSPTNSSKGLGGVLFASLGRKTSIRKDRTLGPASSNKLISSRQAAVHPQPRPVKIVATPTIPGGPRAPARRANSVIPAPASGESPRSVFSMPPPTPGASTTLLESQVQKLSDLLPNADKDVLGIYLRRANNQDPMLAIGAYLEDEKQGTLLNA